MIFPAIFILLWSSSFIFVKLGLQENGPLPFLSLRLLIAWLIILGIFLFTRPALPKSWGQTGKIALTGVLAQGIYQIFFFASLYHNVSPGVLTVVLGTQPIITLLILRESVTWLRVSGLILGLAGLILVVANTLLSGTVTVLGIFYCLISLFGITVGTIFQKKYCSEIHLTTNLLIQYLASSLFVTAIYWIMEPHNIIKWSPSFILALSWMILVISIAATYIFYSLLKSGKATNVLSYLYCVPPVTALLDYALFHHVMSLLSIIGMVLVMISLIMININPQGALLKEEK